MTGAPLRRAGARPAAIFLAGSVLAGSVTMAGIAALPATTIVAYAAGTPSAVSEYQPTINATNPGAPASHSTWGGRGLAVTVDPNSSSTAIVATDSGGLWRTTNGGAGWSHLDGLLPFRMADVRFAPGSSSIVLATTWQTSDSQAPGGIWRSVDGGTTWQQPASAHGAGWCEGGNNFAWGIGFEPGSTNVYVGDDCGLGVSGDSGATWTHVNLPKVGPVVAQSGGIVDVCSVTDGHRRYTNSGGNLTLVNGPSNPGGQACPQAYFNYPAVHDMAAAPQESGVLFAATPGTSTSLCGGTAAKPAGVQFLYESDDSGVNWTSLGGGCTTRQPYVVTHVSNDGNANDFDLFFSGGRDLLKITCTANKATQRCPSLPTTPNVTVPHTDQQDMAFTPGGNCPEFAVGDGGVMKTADCGSTFTMAAGSGSGNGGFNALQVYEVNGQVHPDHTDLYFGTQDNDSWASKDNGATWSAAVCCEGFYFQTPHSAATDVGQTVSFVTCAGCFNVRSPSHFDGCQYNSGSDCTPAWNNPAGNTPGPDTGAPRVIDSGAYVEWTQSGTTPTNQLNLSTDSSATWNTITGATTTQQLMSHDFVVGSTSNPTIYQPYCTNTCGAAYVQPPSGGILKITGARTATAVAPAVVTDASGSGATAITLGTYNNGNGAWLFQEPSLGIDPNNPNHLIGADVGSNTMKVSTDGGSTWNTDTALTNLVTGGGRYPFTVSNLQGTEARAIAFDPTNGNHIVVGTEAAGIIASLDGGTTWFKALDSQRVTAVTSFFFDEVQKDVIVSSYGRGLWKLDLTPRPSTLVYNGATSGDFNDHVTLSATLTDTATGGPVVGARVDFTLGSQSCSGTTDGSGRAACDVLLAQHPGSYTVTATFSGNGPYQPSNTSSAFTINHEESATTYTGPTSSDYHDSFTASATLNDPAESPTTPIAGKQVTFTLNDGAGDTCTSTTDAGGNASCSITPSGPAGSYSITATFAGDTDYVASTSGPVSFTVNREETTTAYTGPTVIANGQPTTLSGNLKEDGTTPIAGRVLILSLCSTPDPVSMMCTSTSPNDQFCTAGPTDSSGNASCTLTTNQPGGPGYVTASFAGDPYYLPSQQTVGTIFFSFLSSGAFVVGDQSVAPGANVEFWGNDWATQNSLSGGPAPNAFKGFATSTGSNPPSCGQTWTGTPGNSGDAPAAVPAYMGVIVATKVAQSGPIITGDTFEIIVIRTDPGYSSNPGHRGTGTVVAAPANPMGVARYC